MADIKNDNDFSLFSAEFAGIKKLQQDTIKLAPRNIKNKSVIKEKREQNFEQSHFSDSFEPHLPDEGPMRYNRSDTQKYLVKQLRRGDFTPEIILDLHGLTQQEAKSELAALINCCKKEGLYCCSVIHGVGKHILKRQVPLWLAQHPDILAFHQAPLEFGGQGALSILVELQDWQMKEDKKR